jgi:hypothetical protein
METGLLILETECFDKLMSKIEYHATVFIDTYLGIVPVEFYRKRHFDYFSPHLESSDMAKMRGGGR